jgi:hypothetical protein
MTILIVLINLSAFMHFFCRQNYILFLESETVFLDERNGLERSQSTIELINITEAEQDDQYNCTIENRAGKETKTLEININSKLLQVYSLCCIAS